MHYLFCTKHHAYLINLLNKYQVRHHLVMMNFVVPLRHNEIFIYNLLHLRYYHNIDNPKYMIFRDIKSESVHTLKPRRVLPEESLILMLQSTVELSIQGGSGCNTRNPYNQSNGIRNLDLFVITTSNRLNTYSHTQKCYAYSISGGKD